MTRNATALPCTRCGKPRIAGKACHWCGEPVSQPAATNHRPDAEAACTGICEPVRGMSGGRAL